MSLPHKSDVVPENHLAQRKTWDVMGLSWVAKGSHRKFTKVMG